MNFKIKLLFMKLFVFSVIIGSVFQKISLANSCKDVQIPSKMDQIRIDRFDSNIYPGNKNLFRFSFLFDGTCGHASQAIRYPTKKITQELINNFYRGKIISPVYERHDPPSQPHGKDRFSFTTQQNHFGNRFSYVARVDLEHDQKFIHMVHSSAASASLIRAEGPYSGLRDVQWSNSCEQESAGWCFAWNATFSIIWELKEGETIDRIKEYVIQIIMPSVFQESYIQYAQFLHKVSN